ncbi:uncharacterized protein LOC122501832 isoform X2 [Leptopilina heterotoma]|uniref:uncharacterized protein LOC122501832 isoform X1 n=1 Tax=Leptopilina heterotoma TaxID=63436 RepID=UPI001CA92D38|nr:uncharacterized protein LOC122501832 isoform X1 [Leptopilina heterotoma]XP_043467530.1 uncharacterized protein LOC122501832 isoform X2 [Leptopilina heterotoma]
MSDEDVDTKTGKKSRVGRIKYKQQVYLLSCIEENPILLTKQFTRAFSKVLYNQEWAKLTENLNKMSDNNRESEKWQRVLGSWVSKVKNKVAELKKIKKSTGKGNLLKTCTTLTDLEERLYALKGRTSVEGDGETGEIGFESDTEAVDFDDEPRPKKRKVPTPPP